MHHIWVDFGKSKFCSIFDFFIRGYIKYFCKKWSKIKFLGFNAIRLRILLRVQRGMTFHVSTIFNFVSTKILKFFGEKLGFQICAKNKNLFVCFFDVISI